MEIIEKKFDIEKIDDDTYKVKSLINDKELTFKRNVELARKIQSVNANARLNMIKWMKEENITKADLIEKTEKNGKIIYDETTYRDLERGFIEDESKKLAESIFNILFGKSAVDVMIELGFNNEYVEEARRFGEEINKILTKKSPRR